MTDLVARTGAWTLEIVKRSAWHRVVVPPKRRIVERTLGWISRSRRLIRDERNTRKAAAVLRLATIRIMIRRLAVSASI